MNTDADAIAAIRREARLEALREFQDALRTEVWLHDKYDVENFLSIFIDDEENPKVVQEELQEWQQKDPEVLRAEEIGRRLTSLRSASNKSKKALGISREQRRAHESGDISSLTDEMFEAYAKHYGVQVGWVRAEHGVRKLAGVVEQ